MVHRDRLLILTPEYGGSGGGIMSFYRFLAPAFREAGIEVHVIAGSAFHMVTEPSVRICDGITVERLERSRVDSLWGRFATFAAAPGLRRHLSAAWAMWEQAKSGATADIIIALDFGLLFVPPTIEATRPLIAQCHGSMGQISLRDPLKGQETEGALTRLLERSVMLESPTIHTHSNANAIFWSRQLSRDVTMIRPAWEVTEAITAPSSRRGLVIGRVQRWKGPQIVCEALARLGARAPGIDWFGRDTSWGKRESSSAAHLAAAFPAIWGTRIVHHPPIPPEDVARRQASALFNLIPSTWDVFNFTVVEAMASGRPAIVSTGAGASELISDGINGFLFPAGDAEALAETIERVMSESPVRLAEIGAAARDTVRSSLDPDKIAAERIAAYRAAIDDFKRSPPAPVGGWLGDICRPSTEGAHGDMAFLDHHPLRSILSYSARRLGRRLWRQ